MKSEKTGTVWDLPRSMWRLVMAVWLALLVLVGAYWAQLYAAHQSALADAQQQVRLRAGQAAQALAYQTESNLHKINFIVQHVGEHWPARDAT